MATALPNNELSYTSIDEAIAAGHPNNMGSEGVLEDFHNTPQLRELLDGHFEDERDAASHSFFVNFDSHGAASLFDMESVENADVENFLPKVNAYFNSTEQSQECFDQGFEDTDVRWHDFLQEHVTRDWDDDFGSAADDAPSPPPEPQFDQDLDLFATDDDMMMQDLGWNGESRKQLQERNPGLCPGVFPDEEGEAVMQHVQDNEDGHHYNFETGNDDCFIDDNMGGIDIHTDGNSGADWLSTQDSVHIPELQPGQPASATGSSTTAHPGSDAHSHDFRPTPETSTPMSFMADAMSAPPGSGSDEFNMAALPDPPASNTPADHPGRFMSSSDILRSGRLAAEYAHLINSGLWPGRDEYR